MSAEQSFEGEHLCHPTARMPAWWCAFIFHVLNPRQVCMYTYLAMLSDERGECSPTIEQIREDLGLFSSSMVFEALATLEDLGFILRERRLLPGARSRRNLYRRPPCAATILRLLERECIDENANPTNPSRAPASPESQLLVEEGLREILGHGYDAYASAVGEAKRKLLIELLTDSLES